MIKDKTHSDKTKEINRLKKKATATQEALKSIKDIITSAIKADHNADLKDYFTLLATTRINYKKICQDIRTFSHEIKTHQRCQANQWMKVRMYALVLRQLNPMQKGIQALHAVTEYSQMVKKPNCPEELKVNYETWADRDKTMIVLDAGTSDDLVNACLFLKEHNITYKVFHEPDLYGVITAVSFIVDERVFDAKKYPDYADYVNEWELDYILTHDDQIHAQPSPKEWMKRVFAGHDPKQLIETRYFLSSKKLSA